jgi:hypothetical protein
VVRGGRNSIRGAALTTIGLQVPEAGFEAGYLALQYLFPVVWFFVRVLALIAI